MYLSVVAATLLAFLAAPPHAVAQNGGRCEQLLHSKWKACRLGDTKPSELSRPSTALPADCIDAAVPGTVLTTLLKNGTFSDPFYEMNLLKIPDISQVGKGYYTFVYVRDMDDAFTACPGEYERFSLHIRTATYIVQAWLNGAQMTEESGVKKSEGSFIRRSYCLTDHSLAKGKPARVAVLVSPPTYPGRNESGQGGDHLLSKNAAIQQCAAGWDWVQATPDRNTGLWDAVWLQAQGTVVLKDPYVHTLAANVAAKTAKVEVYVDIQNTNAAPVTGTVTIKIGDKLLEYSKEVTVEAKTTAMVSLDKHDLSGVEFWWPHTHGKPHLYKATVSFNVDGAVSDTQQFNAGIRHTRTWVDTASVARIFEINGVKIFLQGGNWIMTDQLLRFATDRERYYNEVRMHKEAGMNFIRIWGGGLAERPEFYDACDSLGLVVMQDFWMTGDNNGRWGGEFDWPENHDVYMENAVDTVRLLRRHPSLLLWCGGNEIFPVGQSPPANIHLGLMLEIDRLTPGGFFIPTSMASSSDYDPDYALSAMDGPYGVQLEDEYFYRNPGLRFSNGSRADNVISGFNPELGSVSSPVVESLRRFMSEETLAKFPGKSAAWDAVDAVWVFHNYLPFSNDAHDFLYDLGTPTDIEEYSIRAQFVQYTQFRALFEGFQDQMWTWYTGMAFWKSQSPWPALRGALYDWYLEYTGGLWGVRNAIAPPVHIQLNTRTRTPTVVNKPTQPFPGGRIDVVVRHVVTGAELARIEVAVPRIAGESVFHAQDEVPWPSELSADGSVAFVDLSLYETGSTELTDRNQYWLWAPGLEVQTLKQMGDVRAGSMRQLLGMVTRGWKGTVSNVTLTLENVGEEIAHMVMVSMVAKDGENTVPVTPVWYNTNYFNVLPGESQTVEMEVAGWDGKGDLYVVVKGWNMETLESEIGWLN